MSNIKLVAQTRTAAGSPAARRLRAEGHIPGVLYGRGMTPVSVTVERRDLRAALSGPAGVNTVLTLEVGAKSYPAVVKELQRHPIKRTVSHIDFLQVDMNVEITVNIPLHLTGEAKAVLADGGLVDAAVDTIEVVCTPTNMPAEFSVDITDMQPHGVIRLSDLVMPNGVTATGDPDMPIVTVLTTAAAVATEAEGAAATAEGEAAQTPSGEGEAAGGE